MKIGISYQTTTLTPTPTPTPTPTCTYYGFYMHQAPLVQMVYFGHRWTFNPVPLVSTLNLCRLSYHSLFITCYWKKGTHTIQTEILPAKLFRFYLVIINIWKMQHFRIPIFLFENWLDTCPIIKNYRKKIGNFVFFFSFF